jgi:alkanesulfonate monooxygenase SsuD/methylene tetrahydromethanopterin reductase-like flavin-dependent oxidoreductase (luciferase family)
MSAGDLPRFGLWCDFRNPAGVPFEALYEAMLDQIAWAEGLGFGSVWLTEHHFTDDGYTPSPLVIAAAIGARTRTMRIGTSLMLLPLHDPVRLAEDAATLAILTGGRFDLGLATGYREIEFRAFGRSLRNRPSVLEEGVELIRRAWSGGSLAFEGRRFRYPDVRMTPTPARPPALLVGAMAEATIHRAARLGDGFLATQNAHFDAFVEGLRLAGKDPAGGRICAGQWAIVAEDPEAVWAEVGAHALYQINTYIDWGAFGPPDQVPRFESPDQLVAAGVYRLLDAPAAVEELTEMVRRYPQVQDVHFWAQLPGEPVESGSRRLEYMAAKVIPEVRARLAPSEARAG